MNVHKHALRATALRMLSGVTNEDALARSFSMEVATNATLRGHLVRFALPLILADDEIDGEEVRSDLPSLSARTMAPSPSRPIDEKGQLPAAADAAKPVAPRSSTFSGGEGHARSASKGHVLGASPPEPNRAAPAMPATSVNRTKQTSPVPNAPSQGLLEAMARSRMRSATRILFTLHDGRNIMNVEMRELPAYRKAGAKQAVICDRILKHASNADPYWRVNSVITDETLEKFVREFEREVRHVA